MIESVYKTYIDSVHIKKINQHHLVWKKQRSAVADNEEIDDSDYFTRFNENDESGY